MRLSNTDIFWVGGAFLFTALGCPFVSASNGRAQMTLVLGMAAATAIANTCFAVEAWRGGRGWRVAAVIATLPTALVLVSLPLLTVQAFRSW